MFSLARPKAALEVRKGGPLSALPIRPARGSLVIRHYKNNETDSEANRRRMEESAKVVERVEYATSIEVRVVRGYISS